MVRAKILSGEESTRFRVQIEKYKSSICLNWRLYSVSLVDNNDNNEFENVVRDEMVKGMVLM